MAPRKSARESTPAAAAPVVSAPAAPVSKPSKATGQATTWDAVLQNIYSHYIKETSQRTKLIDAFLVFLLVVGALQFVYCVVAGNYVRGRIMYCSEYDS